MKTVSKIVCAEDDPISQRIISACVWSCGAVPIETTCGRRAWQTLKDNPDTDLLITDMVMPKMSGRELITVVRNDETLKHIPIIIVSGRVSVNEIYDLLLQGASRFVPKPLNVTMLRYYINYLLKHKDDHSSLSGSCENEIRR